MINGLCKEGLLDDALTLFSQMEDNGCMASAVTFDIVIHALFEKNETDEAKKSFLKIITRHLLHT